MDVALTRYKFISQNYVLLQKVRSAVEAATIPVYFA